MYVFVAVAFVAVMPSCSEEEPEIDPEEVVVPEEPSVDDENGDDNGEDPAPVIGQSRNIELSAQQKALVDATIATSYKLFDIQNTLAKEGVGEPSVYGSQEENIISSPIGMIWSMVMMANTVEGRYQRQILDALGYEGYSMEAVNDFFKYIGSELISLDPTSTFNVANSAWISSLIEPYVKESFIQTMECAFDAPTSFIGSFSPDYDGALINDWASRESEGFIYPYISLPDAGNKFLLANLLHFKGGWVWPFDESKTAKDTFYNEDGSTSTVDMMETEWRQFKRLSEPEYVALKLPYGNEAFSMLVVWPRNNIDECFDAIMGSPEWIKLLATTLEMSDYHYLRMPKFDFKYTSLTGEILKHLGVMDFFDESYSVFTGMLNTEDFKTSDPEFFNAKWNFTSVQTCRISVDEKKTESGFGSYVIGHSGEYNDPDVITLDHPFLFFICERSTGLPMFMARISKF